MKTTIDLDEDKLKRLMKLKNFKTRKEAVDFALTEAERTAKLQRVLETPMFEGCEGDIIDPNYDLIKVRNMDLPSYGKRAPSAKNAKQLKRGKASRTRRRSK
jgi:hypothetical protein